jgi:cytochrome P450
MQVVTKLDVPFFDYTTPEMRGAAFQDAIHDLRARTWLADGPFGSIVLDREAVEFFLKRKDAVFPGTPMTEMLGIDDGPVREVIERNLLTSEGEHHRRLRAFVNPSLSARAIERYRPAMRELLTELVTGLEPHGRCEFVSAIAKVYPARVIATVIGAPLEDAERLHYFSHGSEGVFNVGTMVLEPEEVERAVIDFYAYLEELVERRRTEPGDDLLSTLLAGRNGDRLSDRELINLVLNLMAGGVDPATSQLSHCVRLFAEHPSEWQRLREQPELVPEAVAEVLRHETIVPFTPRVLQDDVVFRDVLFPAGTILMLCMSTAVRERDDEGNRCPFEIEPEGEHPRELGFGLGTHYCVGANLGRAVVEEGLAVLTSRFATIELDGEPQYGPVTGIYGFEGLPIRFTVA